MLFLAALESMPKQDMAVLLAQLNAITPSRAVSESLQKMGLRIKDGILNAIARGTQLFSVSWSGRIHALRKACDWDANVIRKSIEEETLTLSQRNKPALRAELREHLFELGKVKPGVDDTALARAVILRAAESMEIPNARQYINPADLENEVFETWVKQLLTQLEALARNRPDELEGQLRNELAKLTKVEREAMGRALQIKRVSAEAIISILRTSGSTLAAQLLVGGFGFGAFLFLTTTLKATGLLLGAPLGFGAYIAAVKGLAFLLSPPFLLLVVALSGGVALWRGSNQLDGYKAQLLVVIGRSQLLAATQKRGWRRWVERIMQWLSFVWKGSRRWATNR